MKGDTEHEVEALVSDGGPRVLRLGRGVYREQVAVHPPHPADVGTYGAGRAAQSIVHPCAETDRALISSVDAFDPEQLTALVSDFDVAGFREGRRGENSEAPFGLPLGRNVVGRVITQQVHVEHDGQAILVHASGRNLRADELAIRFRHDEVAAEIEVEAGVTQVDRQAGAEVVRQAGGDLVGSFPADEGIPWLAVLAPHDIAALLVERAGSDVDGEALRTLVIARLSPRHDQHHESEERE